MSEPTISFEDWQAELDAVRGKEKYYGMTDSQFEFIRYARDNRRPVAWETISELFEKHYGIQVVPNTLSTRYRNECQRRGIKY